MAEKLNEGSTTKNGLITESDLNLSYELPDNSPDPDFRRQEAQAIDDIVSEFYSGDDSDPEEPQVGLSGEPDEGTEDGSAEDPADGENEAEAEQGTAKPEDDAEPEPGVARGIERLVQRELKAQAREAAAEAREVAARKAEDELKSLKGLKPTAELQAQMEDDPYGALKALGKDPEHVVRVIMAQSLKEAGEEVPDSLKKYLKDSSDNRRIKALEAKIAEQERAQAASVYYKTQEDGAREYVTKKVDVKKFPTVADGIKADPEFTFREVWEEIIRDSQARAAQDPNGDPMSPEQAVANVEAKWARYKALFGGQVPNGRVTDPTKIAPGPLKKTPPQTKSARPLAPWQQRTPQDDPYESGIQEAMREYNTMEAKRKQARR